jgi:hypothetical protein
MIDLNTKGGTHVSRFWPVGVRLESVSNAKPQSRGRGKATTKKETRLEPLEHLRLDRSYGVPYVMRKANERTARGPIGNFQSRECQAAPIHTPGIGERSPRNLNWGSKEMKLDAKRTKLWVDSFMCLRVFVAVWIIALFLPGCVHHKVGRSTASMNACVNVLRAIDAAKQEWALEHDVSTNAAPAWTDVLPFLANRVPTCPRGGTYTLGRIDEDPTCSIGGPAHTLPPGTAN